MAWRSSALNVFLIGASVVVAGVAAAHASGISGFDSYSRLMNSLSEPDAVHESSDADGDGPRVPGRPAIASVNATHSALRALYHEQQEREAELEAIKDLLSETGSEAERSLIRAHEARLRAIGHQIQALKTAAEALRKARERVGGESCSGDEGDGSTVSAADEAARGRY